MDAQSLKDKARRWIYGLFDEGNFDLIGEMATEDWKYYMNALEPYDSDSIVSLISGFREAIPDLNNTFEQQVAEGNVVVTIGTTRGTHLHAWGDLPASGNPVAIKWITITRFEDGLIAEDREIYDEFSLMKQLGVIPEPV